MARHGTEQGPTVDAEMVAAHCEVVFGYLEGFANVRAPARPSDRSAKTWTAVFPCDASLGSEVISFVRRAAQDRRNVYIVPSALHEKGPAKTENIKETAVLVVDIDNGDIASKRDLLVQHLGGPTLTIASGGVTDDGVGKLHLYWRLTEAARGDELETVTKLRETLARKAGGDLSFKARTQPIRIAGSLHCKSDPPVLTTILDQSGTELDLVEAAQRIAAMPATFEAEQAGAGIASNLRRPSVGELRTRRVRAGGVDGTTRFDAISSVIGHWIRLERLGEVSLEEAWCAVCEYNAARIDPPWDDARLRCEFDALRRRDAHANAPLAGASTTLAHSGRCGRSFR